MTSQKL